MPACAAPPARPPPRRRGPRGRPAQPARQQFLQRMAVADQVRRRHRGEREHEDGNADRLLLDVLVGQADRGDHHRELAHLCEVDRRQQARPMPEPQPAQDREHDDEAARIRNADASSASPIDVHRGHRNLHAQRDEEQRHEEVAEADHFGHHVEVVGERGDADARDERPHLAGEPAAFAAPRSQGSTTPASRRAPAPAASRRSGKARQQRLADDRLAATSSDALTSEPSSVPNRGRAGWAGSPSKTIAQRSWRTSTPSVMRPGSVSSSNLS